MAANQIETVGVVGAGQMGNGIAHVAALAGCRVILSDIDDDILSRAVDTIGANLDRQIRKGIVTDDTRDEILARIETSTHLRAHRVVDLVVESAVERFDIKKEIFRRLDEICLPGTIFASNTSSISITRMASLTTRPDRFIGLHFLNPVPVIGLVEVIRGLDTSDEVYDAVCTVAERMGKKPIPCNDSPGFVTNRVLMPMVNEAIWAVYENVATVESVDEIFTLGLDHPLGPLALADLVGLDTCLAVMRILYEGFGDPKYRPCPLLVQMVDGGRLGRKTGRGFYEYTED
jgi:3-hydroxybutyryl-CoA dehydrogenase